MTLASVTGHGTICRLFPDGFSAPHQRADIGGLAFRDLDSDGFPGERGLIQHQ
jgi:hypothetical protein